MKHYIVAMVLASKEVEGYDLFMAVGPRGTLVNDPSKAYRFKSRKRALNAAQGFSTLSDFIRVIEVAE